MGQGASEAQGKEQVTLSPDVLEVSLHLGDACLIAFVEGPLFDAFTALSREGASKPYDPCVPITISPLEFVKRFT